VSAKPFLSFSFFVPPSFIYLSLYTKLDWIKSKKVPDIAALAKSWLHCRF